MAFPTENFTARRSRNKSTGLTDFAGAFELHQSAFELLAQLVPEGIEGSVSTVPGSFKSFLQTNTAEQMLRSAKTSGPPSNTFPD